jgi:hypothetical protein
MTDKLNSSPRKSIGSWMKRAAMAGLLFACRLLSGLWSALWYLAVLLGLLLYVSRDFFPKRKSKPLTSPAQPLRSEPHLRRNGSDVFWEMPGGEIIPVEPLRASRILQEVAEVVGSAYCFEKTRIKLDENL